MTKRYGSTAAIDGLSMKVPEDGIYCLLGKNGAGKTTLMKLIAGHINATSGDVIVDSKKASMANQPECVNFVESNSGQFNMRVSELIETAGALQDGFDLGVARQMAERFELDMGLNSGYFWGTLNLLNIFGWAADGLIVAVIAVFTPIEPLRRAEAAFFHTILFQPNAFLQIVSCLALAVIIYLLNKPVLNHKKI
ncbi:MAG: ATP-binding cassette domain-containing protein [Treponema sp.]|nr:ATP-binding cassette domain-containing protein [Treponema sp.]